MSYMFDETAGSAPEREGRSATPLVIALVVVAVAVIAYFATGMPGMDHSGSTTDHATMSHPGHRLLEPAAFEAVIAEPDVVVINVHVPAADIAMDRTDLTMPFDNLDTSKLPSDRGAMLAVYCRSGTMSAIAVERLLALGYTNVVELEGGTNAWTASGRSLGVGTNP